MKYWLSAIILLFLSMPSVAAWDLNLSEKALPYQAPVASFTSQGKKITLKKYRGQKVMLWLFSTWCHTCVAAAKALEKNNQELKQKGLIVLAIRNHNNGGNPGLSIDEFIGRFSPSLVRAENWVLGEASAQLAKSYNARHYADVYFLIDEQGQVQHVSTSPAATLSTIKQFINEKFIKGKSYEKNH